MRQEHDDENEDADSMDKLKEIARQMARNHNATPREELAGLTPTQARKLLYTPWTDSDAPVKLITELPRKTVQRTRIMQNSRILLEYVKERQPLTATETGNLKRKDVGNLIEEIVPPHETFIDQVRKMNNVINQQDVAPLHTLKTMLEVGSYLKRSSEGFLISSKAEKLMDPERFGEGYSELFRVFFQEYNIAFFTRGPELDEVQKTVAMTLYKLSELEEGRYDDVELTRRVAHFTVLEEYQDKKLEAVDNPIPMVYVQRVFKPLVRFGLLEHQNREYRKTPLLCQFLSFQW